MTKAPDFSGALRDISGKLRAWVIIMRRQLHSWKEIAVFFNRDERTVKRWEKDRGLPVHRFPGTNGRVFADTDEIAAWLQRPSGAEPVFAEAEAVQAADTPVTDSPMPVRQRSYWLTVALSAALALVLLAFAIRSGWIPLHRAAAAKMRRTNPEAEDLYLKGRFYWNKRTPDGLNQALDYFGRAIAKDPQYAAAYAGLADTYNLIREYTGIPDSEAFPKARAAAKRAVELDDALADGHRALAFAAFYGFMDLRTAEREFKRAITLDPNAPATHHWLATYLMTVTRFSEALTQIELAQKLDPASRSILSDKALLLWYMGRRDEAMALLKQIETSDPAFVSPHRYLSYIFLNNAEYPQYLAEAKQESLLTHDDRTLAMALSAEKALAAGGGRAMLEDILRSQKKMYDEGILAPYSLARTCAYLGRKPEATAYLAAAYDKRDSSFLYVRMEPAFHSLETEPSYRNLLKHIAVP